ncbi:hypothetical protein FISHEDRAFT_60386 [Fistulina hepatica ATCC 64428]|uniref:Uncharacterized protein n=1 Tax=Fistulina hepatica ATCC 64428 TaxID=1128425 RepID=A0A0D7A5Y8_9AGAR|nr:hypothetical protein FISHEDRAFT_60386 [Fistulina hepatica ATCC 64428]
MEEIDRSGQFVGDSAAFWCNAIFFNESYELDIYAIRNDVLGTSRPGPQLSTGIPGDGPRGSGDVLTRSQKLQLTSSNECRIEAQLRHKTACNTAGVQPVDFISDLCGYLWILVCTARNLQLSDGERTLAVYGGRSRNFRMAGNRLASVSTLHMSSGSSLTQQDAELGLKLELDKLTTRFAACR